MSQYAWSVFDTRSDDEPEDNIVGPADADSDCIDELFDESRATWMNFVAVDNDLYPPQVLFYGRVVGTFSSEDLITDLTELNPDVTEIYVEWL
jgi:hypothetical protein